MHRETVAVRSNPRHELERNVASLGGCGLACTKRYPCVILDPSLQRCTGSLWSRGSYIQWIEVADGSCTHNSMYSAQHSLCNHALNLTQDEIMVVDCGFRLLCPQCYQSCKIA